MSRSRRLARNTSSRWSLAKAERARLQSCRTDESTAVLAAENEDMAKVAGILGKKVGMTQLFDDKGDVHPATVLQAGPCVITQHKSQTRDGYDAAQIGLVEFVKESRLTKARRGHLEKHNLPPVK